MIPLGQKLQERLLNPELRGRRASESAYAGNNERAGAVENSTHTGNQDPQPRVRPMSVPLFGSGSDTYAYVGVSSQTTASGDLARGPSGAATLRWSSSDLKTAPSASNGHIKDTKDAIITRRTAGKTEQTKASSLKQRHVQPDSGTFTAVVLAQRWLAKLGLQDPHPMTRKLQQASQSSYHLRKFIPESQIQQIVQDQVIQAELYKSNKSIGKPSRMLKAPVVSKDYASYRKILAILYLIKRPSKIRMFVKVGLRDCHLPFKKTQHPSGTDRSVTLTSQNTPEAPGVRFVRGEDAEEFLERQWSVLAPVFVGSHETVPHIDLEDNSILPFLSETIIAKEGGFSKVFKAKIHPDHHHLSETDRGSNIYAIKALKSNDDKSFNQEVTVLRKLSSKHKHVHLITLLATYRHDTTYHLIFAWADADLYDYWRQRDEAPPEEDQIGTWVIEQCRGLADALNSLHRYATSSGTSIFKAFKLSSRVGTEESNKSTHAEAVAFDQSTRSLFGRHGDLKPSNILWYPDSSTTGGHGILKITDFGVTQFNTENMWDTRKTDKLPNSPTYRSPESDLDGRLTTACDIWALGCVYLEFVTWYFGGYKLVHWFCQRRLAPDVRMANINSDTFFTIREEAGAKTASVKPEVLKVIEELREHQRCTEDYNKFLDMIKDDMLVVHQQEALNGGDGSTILQRSVSEPIPISRLGNIRRKSCGDVFRTLGDIKPRSDQEEPASPVFQLHHRTWPQREPIVE